MRALLSAGLAPLLAAGLVLLAGCEEAGEEPGAGSGETAGDDASRRSSSEPLIAPATDVAATPMEERVATLGLLNKRNNISQDIELMPGESREIGPVIVTLAACERTAPWEMPQETGAFVQVDILERGQSDHTRVFSGWLFKQSPSLNVVEHPIYDVWVKDCAMRFPGEDEMPEASASESD